MKRLTDFVQEHMNDDVARLILNRSRWPEIDMDLAAACIESRRKLKNKVREWYDNPELIFPVRLSAEQCSSTATGTYKSALVRRISSTSSDATCPVIADLTGGLGVDTWFLSRNASHVHYHEMQEALCRAAEHNFKILNAGNITVNNVIITKETIDDILDKSRPDIVYMDPARRGGDGRKVFLIEECTPDVLTLRDDVFRKCRHLLIKLSPMADISMICDRLGKTCREVHVIASDGECKELLVWMDREWNDEHTIIAAELPQDYPDAPESGFSFRQSEEKSSRYALWRLPVHDKAFLFEPGKALMKSGCFSMIAEQFGLLKLGASTHYYIADSATSALMSLGKLFDIISCSPLDKRSIKATGKEYPHSEVTARNIPMDTETLRKKLGVTSGDDAHIFGLKSDTEGNLLFVTKRVSATDVPDAEGQAQPSQG